MSEIYKNFQSEMRKQHQAKLELERTRAVMQVTTTLDDYRFRFNNEYELQRGINHVLTPLGYSMHPEWHLNGAGRIDFMFPDFGIGIETKVDGSVMAVNRQLQKYAEHEDIKAPCEECVENMLMLKSKHLKEAIEKVMTEESESNS